MKTNQLFLNFSIFALLIILVQTLDCSPNEYYNEKDGTCVTSCPDGTYIKNSTTCSSCYENCKTCSKGGAYGCESCNAHYFLVKLNQSTTSNKCQKCHESCQNCSDSTQSGCESCKSGYNLNAGSSPNYCCSPNCLTCQGNSYDQCNSCSDGYYLHNLQCINECPEDYIQNEETQLCDIKCHESCLTCETSLTNGCLTCSEGFHLSSKTTPTYCCHESCLTCKGPSSSECLSCEQPLIFNQDNNQCSDINGCQEGFYLDTLTRHCRSCPSNCLTCSSQSPSSCLSCSTGKHISGMDIIGYCCDQSCYSCDGGSAGNCVECWGNQYLVDGYCACEYFQYFDSNSLVCSDCFYNCTNCDGPYYNNCTSCIESVLQEGVCLFECSSNYFFNGSQCIKCHETCATCNEALAVNCLTCQSEQYTLLNGQCLDLCLSLEYYDSEKKQCFDRVKITINVNEISSPYLFSCEVMYNGSSDLVSNFSQYAEISFETLSRDQYTYFIRKDVSSIIKQDN